MISARSDAPTRSNVTAVAERERGERVPLSPAQERFWFLEQLDPGGAAYLVPIAAWLTGPLDVDALRAAFLGVAARHEALRTRFSAGDGQPLQQIDAQIALDMEVVDLGHLPAPRREAEALALATAAARRGFDLSRGPLWRALVVRLDEQRHLLLVVFHHLIVDGRAFPVIFAELSEIYRAPAAPRLPPVQHQYADFTRWHRDFLDGDEAARQLAYWVQKLDGIEPLPIPTDRPAPRVASSRGARLEIPIPPPLARMLRDEDGPRATRLPLFLAAFAAMLHRTTGARFVPIAIPIANRENEAWARVVGPCLNTVILRFDCDDELVFDDLMGQARTLVREARANAEIPFDRVVRAVLPGRTIFSAGPARVMFDHQNRRVAPELHLPGVDARFINVDPGSATFDLVLSVHLQGEDAACSLRYSTDLFDESTARRMLGHFLVLLGGAVSSPGHRLFELPLLGEDERRLMVEAWNATSVPFPDRACLHQLFEAQASRTPDRIALIDGAEKITYRALDERANALAHHLASLGAGPEKLVGVFLDRSATLVIAILAALKAGAGYVPFDRKMPAERVAFMARDAQLELVVSEAEHAGMFPPGTTVIVPRRDADEIEARPVDRPASGVNARNVAYVIYTSGSTGTPKGVVIEHRSAVNAVLATIERYRFLAVDRTLFQSSVTFDSSVTKIFQSICNGGILIVAPEGADFDAVLDLTARYGVPRLTTTPSELAVLNEMPDRIHPGVQIIGAAGENLVPSDVDRILERVPILNIYGPTEATVSTTSFRLTKGTFTAEGTVPIGKPIMNYQVYVLDRRLNVLPIGCTGELCIGGVGLARGYLGAPELTAAKFVENPFRPGERLYKTGDLARWLPDGNLEFRGRIDEQVKIRGYRIELGEIEHALGRHPEVHQAAVIARRDGPSGTSLVAYVVMSPEASTPVSALRDFLGRALPEYMVPARILRVDALPRTISGKLDRARLPDIPAEPEAAGPEPSGAVSIALPCTVLEAELAAIWAKLLPASPIGVEDDFFSLGGHSLLAVRLFDQIHRRFGKKLPIATLFHASTVAELAALLGREGWTPSWSSLVPIRSSGRRRPLFWVHAIGGNVLNYRLLSRYLGDDQPFYGLQSRGLGGGEPPHSRIEEMAADYLGEIRAVQRTGPYLLGGASSGGVIAYEMAQQLRARGEEVETLVMLDTHLHPRPRTASPGRAEDPSARRAPAPSLPVRLDYHLGNLLLRSPRKGFDYLVERGRARLTGRATGPDLLMSPTLRQVTEANLRALESYEPQPYPGRVVMLLSRVGPERTAFDRRLGWADLVGDGMTIRFIPGDHETMLEEPAVSGVAAVLARCLGS